MSDNGGEEEEAEAEQEEVMETSENKTVSVGDHIFLVN